MAATCALIAANIDACGNEITMGHDPVFWLINRSDINTGYTEAAGVISAIGLEAGKFLYKIEGKKFSLTANTNADNSTLTVAKHQHVINFSAFDVTQAARETLDALANGLVVAIVKNSDGTFDVYGKNNGLQVTAYLYDRNNTDTGGAIQLTLQSPEGYEEGKTAQEFLDTDAATTQTWIDTNTAP